PLVKLPGLIAAIFAAWIVRKEPAKVLQIVAGTALGLAISVAVMVPMIASVRSHIVGEGRYFPQFSLQYMLTLIASPTFTIAVTAIIVILLAALALVQASKNSLVAPATLAVALWIALPNPWPWYALWILPLAFVAWDVPASWALVALTLCTVARYLSDATVTPFGAMPSIAIALFELGIPLAVFIAGTKSSRQVRREIRTPAPDLEFSRYS
ncbi:MAG TPA: hypothetical protein VGR69_02170, partial [Candidatus Rubrimentiphilum sp.]|nr:hypothetical protein [Candidatus Rubrimentiphilum sp.]